MLSSTYVACFMFVTTGVSRCGTPSKLLSSTFLGSIMIMRTSSGVARSRIEVMRAFRQPLLPDPVVPAMSRWTMRTRSASTALPVTSLPSQNAIGEACWGKRPWISPSET